MWRDSVAAGFSRGKKPEFPMAKYLTGPTWKTEENSKRKEKHEESDGSITEEMAKS